MSPGSFLSLSLAISLSLTSVSVRPPTFSAHYTFPRQSRRDRGEWFAGGRGCNHLEGGRARARAGRGWGRVGAGCVCVCVSLSLSFSPRSAFLGPRLGTWRRRSCARETYSPRADRGSDDHRAAEATDASLSGCGDARHCFKCQTSLSATTPSSKKKQV